MISRLEAIALPYRANVWFLPNDLPRQPRPRLPIQCRVAGRAQTWVTRPADFRLPVRHGFCNFGAICPSNQHMFFLTHEEALMARDALATWPRLATARTCGTH